MALVITTAKRKDLLAMIRKRQAYLLPSDRFVKGAYDILMDVITIKADSSDCYVAEIASYFSPKFLFNDQIIQSEGQRFYSRIRDILVVAGVKMKPSRVIPLPLQVAKVLYTSPPEADISDEDKAEEARLMEEATALYNLRTFPAFPKYHELSMPVPGTSPTTQRKLFAEDPMPTHAPLAPSPSPDEPSCDPPKEHGYAQLLSGSSQQHKAMMEAAHSLREKRHRSTSPRSQGKSSPSTTSAQKHIPAPSQSPSSNEKASALPSVDPEGNVAARTLSRRKSNFISTLAKKDTEKFSGTDGRSWTCHIQNYIALAKAHDISEESVLLEMIQFTLGPGPKMTFDRYVATRGATWDGFQDLMVQKHNSAIAHARVRDSMMSVSLRDELRLPDDGTRDTRNARAVTRVVDKILRLAKDLPPDEAQDKHLLQVLRMAIQGVHFTKNAQLLSVQDEQGTFDALSSAIQTAAQVEDSYSRSSGNTSPCKSLGVHLSQAEDFEETFDSFFVDRRLGRVPPRRSKKCGNNRKENGTWNGKVLKCHDCSSRKHLKFHRECPTEVERRKMGRGVLDGVHKQLRDGAKPIQVMACLAIALEDATSHCDASFSLTPTQSSDENVIVSALANCELQSLEDMQEESELFQTNFAERFGHSLHATLFDSLPPHDYLNNGESGPSDSYFVSNATAHQEVSRCRINSHFMPNLPPFIGTDTSETPTSILLSSVTLRSTLMSTMFQSTSPLPPRSRFFGAVVDTGAARSCIGIQQAKEYARLASHTHSIRPSSSTFKFGDVCHPSRGIITIALPTPSGHDVFFNADVVDANVPLLLGLNTLDEHNLMANTSSNELVHKDWSIPLERDQGHIWVRWPDEILYSGAQLLKLHRHYKHPSASKLFALLKRIDPENLPSSTLSVLQDIQKNCDPCEIIDGKQMRFQVGSGDVSEIVFNREIVMDIVKVGDRNALHIIDAGTHFGAAKFLSSVDTKTVWNALLDCWVLVYAGQPDVFFMDQGSAFTSDEWRTLAAENGVVIKYSGVQHHNGISICERYHSPLKRIYRKLEIEYPEMDEELMLKTAIKAMNDTLGPEGLVPTMLVFGIMPRYAPAGLHGTLPDQKSRLRAIHTARQEYLRISNSLRVSRALRAKVPEDADRVYSVGDTVRVYREEKKAYSEPLTVLEISNNNRMVKIDMGNGLHQLYSTSQIKPYKGTENEASDFVRKVSDSYGPWLRDYVRPDTFQVHITEVIDMWDPRAESPKMKEAIKREIQGLIARGCFRVVLREDLPMNANVLGSRLVLAIKDGDTGEERYKARLVIGGHLDKDKASLVHASPNLHQDSARMLLALASVMGFKVWTQDIAQAYFQSSTKLMREIYMKPTKEFNLQPDQILQLMKPLYGLADSGDRWHHTLKEHHIRDLGMTPTDGDLSLYSRHIGDRLSGLSGVYVDDTLQAGDENFQKWAQKTSDRFDATPRVYSKGKFAGMDFDQAADCSSINVSMQRYIARKLQLAPVPCTFELFRSGRAQLAWTTHCRPDVSCAVAMSSQVTEKIFDPVGDARAVNKIIRHLKKHELSIIFPALDRNSLHIRAYADASHANNRDYSSQLGIVILLCDMYNKCSLIGYKSYKCQRVTRSALASECHALADAFDYAYMLKHDLESLINQNIPIQMFTDCKSLFDVIVKASRTAERRLMIDIAACREAYERHEIADIGLVRSGFNLADCMTKIMRPTQLMEVMRTAYLKHPVEQWVIRRTT